VSFLIAVTAPLPGIALAQGIRRAPAACCRPTGTRPRTGVLLECFPSAASRTGPSSAANLSMSAQSPRCANQAPNLHGWAAPRDPAKAPRPTTSPALARRLAAEACRRRSCWLVRYMNSPQLTVAAVCYACVNMSACCGYLRIRGRRENGQRWSGEARRGANRVRATRVSAIWKPTAERRAQLAEL